MADDETLDQDDETLDQNDPSEGGSTSGDSSSSGSSSGSTSSSGSEYRTTVGRTTKVMSAVANKKFHCMCMALKYFGDNPNFAAGR